MSSQKNYKNIKMFLLCFLCSFMFYSVTFLASYNDAVRRYQEIVELDPNQSWFLTNQDDTDNPYLINTTGCKIENIDPFDPEVMKFFQKPQKIHCDGEIITYILKEGNDVYLVRNDSIATNGSLECSYQGVERNLKASKPDNELRNTTDVITFTQKTLIKQQNIVRVWCGTDYENYHYIFNNENQTYAHDNARPNVLLIGYDAMSRSNIFRNMPKTVEFIRENGWINLKGYNKILHNTCPNLMAVMTGLSPNDTDCDSNIGRGEFQNRNDFIWNHYKSQNYTTAYSEDFPVFSTFNYGKRGFLEAPTDYYLRPYFVALRKLNITDFCSMEQCFGPVNIGPQMAEFVKDFVGTVHDRSNYFGFFWMNAFSHSSLSCPTNMDIPTLEMFQHLKDKGVLDNTIVIFFSDHGFRFGKISETNAGYLENRLPFIFISIPKLLRLNHRDKYLNLIQNAERLTTPYDLYMTLHHIIHLYNSSHVMPTAKGCSNCHSLFDPVSGERTCADVGVSEYWCTCSKYVAAEKNDTLSIKATNFALEHINELVTDTNCSQYIINEILQVKFYKTSATRVKNVMLRVEFAPPARFELNLEVNATSSNITFFPTDIERLDHYAETSWCTDQTSVRMFCYCF